MMNIKIESLDKIDEAAIEFIKTMGDNTVFAFRGEMGAGKTTFIKAICEELGVKETVNRPTFSIVNEYESREGEIIYHFDCYRIEKVQDAFNLGAEEYLYSGNYCFIEWADNIEQILPENAVNVDIEEVEDGIRMVTIDNK